MAKITNTEFVKQLVEIAENHKTLYVYGCFGAPMNATNKKRYCNNTAYNKKAARTKKINAATADTFGFDCVNLLKGVLWGWNGDTTKTYGGAKYAANGVPDTNADGMIKLCSDVTTDFSKIEVGEAVWFSGHIGVYIGKGLAVECTPTWEDGVQITAVKNIGAVVGFNARKWTKHGKLPYITYEKAAADTSEKKPETTAKPNKVKEWQQAAIADGFKFPKYGADGKWGAECEKVAKEAICKKRLTYKYKNLTKIIQKAVGVTADGKYGSDTKKAVAAWQKLMGLTADGCVGINTWKKILGVK